MSPDLYHIRNDGNSVDYQHYLTTILANKKSQLNVIMEKLGSPKEEELSFLNKDAIEILKALPAREGMVSLTSCQFLVFTIFSLFLSEFI
jgi:hypothetical protein